MSIVGWGEHSNYMEFYTEWVKDDVNGKTKEVYDRAKSILKEIEDYKEESWYSNYNEYSDYYDNGPWDAPSNVDFYWWEEIYVNLLQDFVNKIDELTWDTKTEKEKTIKESQSQKKWVWADVDASLSKWNTPKKSLANWENRTNLEELQGNWYIVKEKDWLSIITKWLRIKFNKEANKIWPWDIITLEGNKLMRSHNWKKVQVWEWLDYEEPEVIEEKKESTIEHDKIIPPIKKPEKKSESTPSKWNNNEETIEINILPTRVIGYSSDWANYIIWKDWEPKLLTYNDY